MSSAAPFRWERGGERLLASTRVFEVRSRRYRHPGRGSEGDFAVISAPEWVNVAAVTPGGRIVLVRQFRAGIDGFSLELPGGTVEPGEDPVAAGARELREETGYAGVSARRIGWAHPNPAIMDNRCHFVLVEGAEPRGATAWDADEEIEVSTASVEEAVAWAASGRISHSLSLCGLFLLRRALGSGGAGV